MDGPWNILWPQKVNVRERRIIFNNRFQKNTVTDTSNNTKVPDDNQTLQRTVRCPMMSLPAIILIQSNINSPLFPHCHWSLSVLDTLALFLSYCNTVCTTETVPQITRPSIYVFAFHLSLSPRLATHTDFQTDMNYHTHCWDSVRQQPPFPKTYIMSVFSSKQYILWCTCVAAA